MNTQLSGTTSNAYRSPKYDDLYREDREMNYSMSNSRKAKGFYGLMLKAVPKPATVSSVSAVPGDYGELKRYRLQAHLLILLPLSMFYLAKAILPALSQSPVTAASGAIDNGSNSEVASTIVGLLMFGLLGTITFFVIKNAFNGKLDKFLFQAALMEEVDFRYGSEDWTTWQRVKSCVAFGFAHIMNLIVAFATLGSLAIIGGVFMWIYLRHIKMGDSPQKAIQTAARFHADYNTAAIFILVSSFIFLLGLTGISALT